MTILVHWLYETGILDSKPFSLEALSIMPKWRLVLNALPKDESFFDPQAFNNSVFNEFFQCFGSYKGQNIGYFIPWDILFGKLYCSTDTCNHCRPIHENRIDGLFNFVDPKMKKNVKCLQFNPVQTTVQQMSDNVFKQVEVLKPPQLLKIHCVGEEYAGEKEKDLECKLKECYIPKYIRLVVEGKQLIYRLFAVEYYKSNHFYAFIQRNKKFYIYDGMQNNGIFACLPQSEISWFGREDSDSRAVLLLYVKDFIDDQVYQKTTVLVEVDDSEQEDKAMSMSIHLADRHDNSERRAEDNASSLGNSCLEFSITSPALNSFDKTQLVDSRQKDEAMSMSIHLADRLDNSERRPALGKRTTTDTLQLFAEEFTNNRGNYFLSASHDISISDFVIEKGRNEGIIGTIDQIINRKVYVRWNNGSTSSTKKGNLYAILNK